MPNYEYLCTKCGHRFEQIRKFSDKPLRKCPECGGLIEQVISAPAVQFKGSGWYVNDYAATPNSGEGKKSEGAAGDAKETNDSASKDSSSKDSGSKDSSSKDLSGKDGSSKESTVKDSKGKKAPASKKD